VNCPNELTLAMYGDGELAADDTATIDAHLTGCAACRSQLAALRAESALITAALVGEVEPVGVPTFRRPLSRAALTLATAGFLLAATLVSAAPSLLGNLLPASVTRFNPFDISLLFDLAVRAAIYVVQHGGDLMISVAETASVAVVVGLLAWAVFVLRKRASGPLLVSTLLCVVALQPAPSEALEIRGEKDHGNVFVPAGETIDDTLIALGETVEINGDVTGDLIAFGRRITIHGRVGGQVLTGGQAVTIAGEVEGSVIGGGETFDVISPRIGGNLYGFGQTVSVSATSQIEQNAIVGAERANVMAAIGRDVIGFANEMDLGSTVGGSLTAFATHVTLLASTRIAGNVHTHGMKEDHLTISPGAVIGGEVKSEVQEMPDELSEYRSAGFYVAQLLRFAMAFVTGALLLAIVPGLRDPGLDSTRDTLIAGGYGLLALVATPIIVVLVAVTVIGIPIAAMAFVLWLLGIYLAKIVIAHFIGERITAASGTNVHFTVALALGLLLVIFVINLPFVGGVLNFLLTICGIGVLILFVRDWLRDDGAYGEQAS